MVVRWGMAGLLLVVFETACFEDVRGPGGEGTGSTTEASTGASPCVPGQTQSCACAGGGSGVQFCDAAGLGYGMCDCSGDASTSTPDSTTTTASSTGGGEETTDSTGTSASIDTSTSTSTDSGGEESSSTGEPEPSYEACPGGPATCNVAGALCLTSVEAMPKTVCSAQGCVSAPDCPAAPTGYTAACADVSADGTSDCYLPCMGGGDCPAGMVCQVYAISLCMWP